VPLVLGIAGGLLALVPALWYVARGKPAATPVMAAAVQVSDPVSDPAPAADVPAVPEVPSVEDEEADPMPPAPAPAPGPEKELDPEPIPEPRPEPPAAVVAKPPERPHKLLSENDLRLQLHRAPEFGLTPAVRDSLVVSYKADYQTNTAMSRRATFDPYTLLSHVPNARQLPIRQAPGCQLSPNEAATLGVLARKLHAYLDLIAPKDANGKRGDPVRLRAALRLERRGKRPEWLRPEALPAMTQILMAEDVPLRLVLVDMMADIEGKAATVRLAQRAVYDLSPEVREAAIEALHQRPFVEARQTLVDALRYPWPAVADHAADALAALGDRDAAPLLVALLDKPDPAAPFATQAGASVREVVRVKHIENCLLCHAPASGRDPVTDVDPFAGRPQQTYELGRYGRPRIPGSGNGVWANRVLIRADVQFLRQDFSITFPPGRNFPSVDGLRFDFLVRTRPLKPAEVQEWKQQPKPDATAYPQREATLYALRAVTGEDAGPTTEGWVNLYPRARAEAEGLRLSAALRRAPPDEREQLLARYRDAKEDRYTEALAHAIPHVTGKFQERVRTALAERLARLPADELRAHLEGEDELHRAAARACVRKADAEMIPDLIGLLLDADPEVGEAAHQALRRLTGEDFGPPAECLPEVRVAAAAKWQAWYRERGP
jgi:HEAT repeat protein